MLMATTDFHVSRMQQTIRRMLVRQVDGVALLAAEIETEPIESLLHNRVPLVTMDRRQVAAGLSDVSIDYVSGMRQAIAHLKELRHRKIAYIGGSQGLTISDHRLDAFKSVMTEAGLEVNPSFIRAGNYRISGGESGMFELLTLKNKPTAIMTANDLTAIGALRVIHREGFSVPKHFSVVGFDDIELSDIVYPPLTTLRLPRAILAETFFTALKTYGKDSHAIGKRYNVSTELVVRESTGLASKI